MAGSGFTPFSPCEVQADCVSALETTLPHSWSARAHESRAQGPCPWPADHRALHPHRFQHVDPLGKQVASGGRGGRVPRQSSSRGSHAAAWWSASLSTPDGGKRASLYLEACLPSRCIVTASRRQECRHIGLEALWFLPSPPPSQAALGSRKSVS